MTPLAPPPTDLLEGTALFLDFDGTLVELAATPDSIKLDPDILPLLDRLRAKLEGRLAIVSGRSLADLDRHLRIRGIACSGSHGLELRLADGMPLPLSVPLELEEVRQGVQAFAAGKAGILVEEKPAGIALHFRQRPGIQDEVDDFMSRVAQDHGWVVQRGSMVVELRPTGATKGDAIRAFMAKPDFAAGRPLFVGDDLTDEHGFEAARALGGAGILVGPDRATAATYRLDSVAAVAAWLRDAG